MFFEIISKNADQHIDAGLASYKTSENTFSDRKTHKNGVLNQLFVPVVGNKLSKANFC